MPHPTQRPPVYWREKNLLVLDKNATLPDECVKCGTPAEGGRLRVALAWSPIGLPGHRNFIGQILYLFTRRTDVVEIGFCPRCRRRRRRLMQAMLSLIAVGVLMSALAIWVQNPRGPISNVGAYFCMGGIALAIFSLYGLAAIHAPVKAVEIDDDFIALSGVWYTYLDRLPGTLRPSVTLPNPGESPQRNP